MAPRPMRVLLRPFVAIASASILGLVAGCPSPSLEVRSPSILRKDDPRFPVESASASSIASTSATAEPQGSVDPWAGPLTWKTSALECAPVKGATPKSPKVHWTAHATGTKAKLRAVAVGREVREHVIAVGDQGTILVSRDAGASFVRCTLPSKEPLAVVSATSADDAWIVGETGLFHLTGPTAIAAAPVELGGLLEEHEDDGWNVSAVATHDVWIFGRHSTDDGVTWSSPIVERSMLLGDPFVGPAPDPALERWISWGFFIWRSVDGGVTWRNGGYQPTAEDHLYVSVGLDDVCVAGRDSMTVDCTRDHGATWTDEIVGGPPPLEHHLGQVWSGGGGWAWAVTHDGLWVRPGKAPWTRDLPKNLAVRVGGLGRDVWAVGDSGLLLHRK